MKLNIPKSVLALVPNDIRERVQNGVDTAFSEAADAKSKTVWAGSVSGSGDKLAVAIKQKVASQWKLAHNAPGLFTLLCIHVHNLTEQCGEVELKSLPDFCEPWFKKLAARGKE